MASAPASHRATNARVLSLLEASGKLQDDVLDLGAGRGYFTRLLSAAREAHGIPSGKGIQACDIEKEAFDVADVGFRQADLNQGLPYVDAAFDAVVTIEVLEHTRTPYAALAEIARVLKPGGVLIFSVPNVGHLVSRFNFLATGHYQLYHAPSTVPENMGRISGHVAPLPYQYWHYGLRLAGFSGISLHGDRTKRAAAALAVIGWPLGKLLMARTLRRLAGEPKLYAETAEVTRNANSWPALTSRSLVFSAVKPA
jgi:2-polyprenyl-6-hydroxyphenyl methylase/3-demethylubiquinone-9 3-methyltransferase